MTKLTESQTTLLASISVSPDEALDAPDDRKTVSQLIKRGLIISVPQQEGPSRLFLTEMGRQALQPTPAAAGSSQRKRGGQQPSGTAAIGKSPSGKLGQLIELLKRPEGATIVAMTAATGWQAHSVRGAMSGALKKKLGLVISSEKDATGRIYRITSQAGA